jgi:hypothetical protein
MGKIKAVILFSIVLGILLSCGESIKEFPSYSGTIIISGTYINALDVKTGAIRKYNSEEFPTKREAAAFLPGDTVLLIGRGTYDGKGNGFDGYKTSLGPVYKFNPQSGHIEIVESLNDTAFTCRDLDYLPEQDLLLYYGKYESEKGLYILDRDFQLKDNHTPYLAPCTLLHESCHRMHLPVNFHRAIFVSEDTIVVSDLRCVALLSIRDSNLVSLDTSGRIVGFSNDRRTLVVQKYLKEETWISMIDLETMQRQTIDSGEFWLNCSFSTDDKAVAFCENVDSWGTFGLFLWDIESKTALRTGFKQHSQSGKAVLWLESEYVVPD